MVRSQCNSCFQSCESRDVVADVVVVAVVVFAVVVVVVGVPVVVVVVVDVTSTPSYTTSPSYEGGYMAGDNARFKDSSLLLK